MNRIKWRSPAAVLVVVALAISAGCRTDGMKPVKGGGTMVTYAMETIYARTKDTPSKTVVLDISLHHRGGVGLTEEIDRRSGELGGIVKSIINEKYHFEMYRVDDYEKLHVVIKDAFNGTLRTGSVDKVFFRSFEIR